MKKKLDLLLICCILLFSINSISAQKRSLPKHILKKDTTKALLTREDILNPVLFNNPLAKYNYYNCLGVMCQLEYKMQKAIKVPLCFRLGSVAYTNKIDAQPVNPNP